MTTPENKDSATTYKEGFSEILENRNAFMNGAKVGVIVGALAGVFLKKNVFLFGAIGFVAGGYVSSQILRKKAEYKNKYFKTDENDKK